METREYHTVENKAAEWGDGPWVSEPDKKQWQDPATGLPCLIVRGPLGALCGYVGVPPDHPLFKKDYDEADVSVHGGLTFAAMCNPEEKEDEGICHVPGPGEPDHAWWLGFDCGHHMDLIPYRPNAKGLEAFAGVMRHGTYRDIAYVTEEVTNLAKQLKEIA